MNVLMVGVDKRKVGGMWSVAETYMNDEKFNKEVNLTYIATSTEGSAMKKILKMLKGYYCILFTLINGKIDIVHIHMAEKGSVYRKGFVVFMAKFFNKKVIIQMHSGPIMNWYENLSNKKKKIVRNIFNKCDKFLVLGNYWKKELGKIVPDYKVRVLYNGVDCPLYNRYNSKGNYIMFLGMVNRKKGAYDLIDAIEIINNKLPQSDKILLCGYDKNDEAKQYIQAKGLQNRFVLTGWINILQIENYFNDAKLFTLPSYFEGLSMSVIEAMCHGIPVVTTNISTMPELMGTEIELVNPGDIKHLAYQILKLSQNENLRIEQSDILFNRARKKFSKDLNIINTLSIYKECIYQ